MRQHRIDVRSENRKLIPYFLAIWGQEQLRCREQELSLAISFRDWCWKLNLSTVTANVGYFHSFGGPLGLGRSRKDSSALAHCPKNNPPTKNTIVIATATRCQGSGNLIPAWIPISRNEHPNKNQESFHRLRLSRTRSASTPCRSSRCLCCHRSSHSHISENPQVTAD